MSGIGPALPPHLLAKRKRQREEAGEDGTTTASGANLPSSPDTPEKRRKVMGPAMPPAPLDERPTEPPNRLSQDSDEGEDDDEFGPALPIGNGDKPETGDDDDHEAQIGLKAATSVPAPEKLRRDDWMMMPPKQDDLAARLDPTKIRARGFNTGKGAKGPSANAEDNSLWNETPEQKQKRLRDEMMGVTKTPVPGPQNAGRGQADTKTDPKTRERIESARGPSLMDQHKQSKGTEAEDDPSKRAFDREKDMGSGMRIGHTQRKEMLNKAAGFSSRFSGGSYL